MCYVCFLLLLNCHVWLLCFKVLLVLNFMNKCLLKLKKSKEVWCDSISASCDFLLSELFSESLRSALSDHGYCVFSLFSSIDTPQIALCEFRHFPSRHQGMPTHTHTHHTPHQFHHSTGRRRAAVLCFATFGFSSPTPLRAWGGMWVNIWMMGPGTVFPVCPCDKAAPTINTCLHVTVVSDNHCKNTI